MKKKSILVSRFAILLSVLIGIGYMLYIAFPDPHTPILIKVIALVFFWAILFFPAALFYAIFLRKKFEGVGVKSFYVVTSILFPIAWIPMIPYVSKAVHSDGLAGLALVAVPIIQLLAWGVAFGCDILVSKFHKC